jgi:YHS domain-containing protein
MCPVTWKQKKQFVNCCQRPEFTILYKHKFYYFAGAAERAVFCSNPSAFIDKTIYSTVRNVPILIREHKAAEVIA